MDTARPSLLRFRWSLGFALIVFLLTLFLILRANNGILIFTADDAYVHFKQAENLLSGHYGINQGEFSAPCSSILWPVLLAPLTLLPAFAWIILGLNLLVVIATIRIQFTLVTACLPRQSFRSAKAATVLAYMLIFSLIFIPNLIPLLFSGMEYVWQILLIHLILLGLIKENREQRIPAYLMPALILCPLIRYESLAIVFPALLYLFMRGHRTKALGNGLIILTALGLFSFFLYTHGIGLLPTSITAKRLHQVGLAGPLQTVLLNVLKNLTNLFNLPLILLLLCVFPPLIFQRYWDQRGLAGVLLAAGLLHLVFGHITFLCRHEAYILAALSLGVIYIYAPDLMRLLDKKRGKHSVLPGTGFFLLLLSLHPLIILCFVPTMSNMAYRHPFQMHRFATEFYPHPVAVNDLGWVCYQNNRYVLDLWGADSARSLKCALQSDSLACIASLAREKQIRAVMITNAWFQNVPASWIKIGDYHRGKDPFIIEKLFGGMFNQVDFYVTDEKYLREAALAICKFRDTLPPTTHFRFTPQIKKEASCLDKPPADI